MKATPKQRLGIEAIATKRLLALSCYMGAGKTKMIIDAFNLLNRRGDLQGESNTVKESQKNKLVLVVCPNSLISNWQAEIKKHNTPADCSKTVIYNGEAKKLEIVDLHNYEEGRALVWLVLGYGFFRANNKAFATIDNGIKGKAFAMVLDESHFIKNPQAARTKLVLRLANHFPRRYILSGTLTTQGLQDIYSQYRFLSQDASGGYTNYWHFAANHIRKDERTRAIIGYIRQDEYLDKLRPYTYSISKEEVLKELPSASYESISLDMDKEEKAFFEQATMNIGTRIAIVQLLRIKEAIFGYSQETGAMLDPEKLCKFQGLSSLIEKAGVDSMLVWFNYKKELEQLKRYLSRAHPERAVFEISGETPVDQRLAIVDEFNKGGDNKILLANQATAGVGFNITGTQLVVFFSNSTRYADRVQAEARTLRRGQQGAVQFFDLFTIVPKELRLERFYNVDILTKRALEKKEDLNVYITRFLEGGRYLAKA